MRKGIAITVATLLIVALCSALFGSRENKRITQDREQRLRPVIAAIDGFIADHNRLPTAAEFESDFAHLDWMLILHDRTNKYAASKGASSATDYMLGIWRADSYHYYKSWDKDFINGYDEELGPVQ